MGGTASAMACFAPFLFHFSLLGTSHGAESRPMNGAGAVVEGGPRDGKGADRGFSAEVSGDAQVECSSGMEVTWAHATYTADRHDNKTVPLVQFDDAQCSVEVRQGKRDLQQVLVTGLFLAVALAVEGIRRGKAGLNRANAQIAGAVAQVPGWALTVSGPDARCLCNGYHASCLARHNLDSCGGALWACNIAAIRTRSEGGDGNEWLDKFDEAVAVIRDADLVNGRRRLSSLSPDVLGDDVAGTSLDKTRAVVRSDGCTQDEAHFFSDACCFTEEHARHATDAEVNSLPELEGELCIVPIAYLSETDSSLQFCCRYFTGDQDENLDMVKSRIINDLRAAYDSLTDAEVEAASQGECADFPQVV